MEANSTATCQPSFAYTNLLLAIVPGIQIVANVIIFILVGRNIRGSLRHNLVYVYVLNSLFANLMFGVSAFYKVFNDALVIERKWYSDQPFRWDIDKDLHRMNWRALHEGSAPVLFIAMSGSICALSYGIRENSHFVGRVANQTSHDNIKGRRRHYLAIILTLVWIVPFFLFIVAATWNCSHKCICTPATYEINPCSSDKTGSLLDCSSLLPTQRKAFLLIIDLLWLIESATILLMNVSTIRKYRRVINARRNTINLAVLSKEQNRRVQAVSRDLPNERSLQIDYSKNHNANDVTISSTQDSNQSSRSTSVSREDDSRCIGCANVASFSHLNNNLKLMITLSVLFLLCTLPGMIGFAVEALLASISLSYSPSRIIIMFTVLYSLLSPLVMIRYMPNLNAVVKNALYKCCRSK